jgi:hypothetical protein
MTGRSLSAQATAALRKHFPALAGQVADAVFHGEHAYWAEQRAGLVKLAAELRLDLQVDF